MQEDEHIDEKVLKMLNKVTDHIHVDDNDYHAFFDKRKQNEEAWRELHTGDNKLYMK